MIPYDGLDEIARVQWGLVSRAQALSVVSPHQLDRLRDGGSLINVRYGVYRLAGSPPSWRQRAMASCLAYERPVALSHRAAARLWELEGIKAGDPEVTISPGRSARRAGILTHRGTLADCDVHFLQGIPVTSPERTLIDLASTSSPHLLERAVDEALRARLVTVDSIQECHRRSGGLARAGGGAIRDILDLRREDPVLGDSAWADRVFRWIVDAGLDAPVRQHQVIIDGRLRILDMAYPDEKIAIEFVGYDAHGRRHRFDADAVRTTALILAGWLVVTVTSRQAPELVVRWVRDALQQRRAA